MSKNPGKQRKEESHEGETNHEPPEREEPQSDLKGCVRMDSKVSRPEKYHPQLEAQQKNRESYMNLFVANNP